MKRLVWALGTSVAVVLVAPRGRADDDEPIRVDYEAPFECPDQASFLAEVRERTTRWHLEVGSAPARRFVIEVTPREGGMRGRLALTDIAGVAAAREVDGATCTDVVEALALMTALAIDPHASLAPIRKAPPPPPPAPPPPPPPAPPPPRRTKQPVPTPPPARWRLAAGAHFDAAGGVAPVLVIGGDAFVEAAWVRASLWSPSVRVLFRYNEATPVTTTAGTAHFSRWLGGVALCPLRIAVTRILALVPCAGFDAGALGETGTDTPGGRHETRTWLDVGSTARLEWAVTWGFGIELEGGAFAALLRYHSTFPTLAVYDNPAVGGFGAAGVRLRFW